MQEVIDIEHQQNSVKLDVGTDIYSYGVIAFLTHEGAQPKKADRLVMKAVFSFALQLILSLMLITQYVENGKSIL